MGWASVFVLRKLRPGRTFCARSHLLALLFAVVVAREAPAQMYGVTDLGTLPGYLHSKALGINRDADVVGYSTSDPTFGPNRAFIWRNGVMTDLSTLGGEGATATGVNRSGDVAGFSEIQIGAAPPSHAFIWNGPPLPIVDLGTLGGVHSWAHGIAASGSVIGASQMGVDDRHACIWQNGTVEDLGALPGHCCSAARALNASQRVVGYSSSVRLGVTHAVAWDLRVGQTPTLRDLGTLGGCCSEAFDVNESGQIVGFSWIQSQAGFRGFLWEDDGQDSGLRDLGSLVAQGRSGAFAINGSGRIVGTSWSTTEYPGEPHACVWHDGAICDLNDLALAAGPWVFTEARDINDFGQIIVNGVEDEKNLTHAFLLTPIDTALGDFDGNGLVALDDYLVLLGDALTGPGASTTLDTSPVRLCGRADLDDDGDVDLQDFAAFQNAFTGSQ